jgi:hypothetical protein
VQVPKALNFAHFFNTELECDQLAIDIRCEVETSKKLKTE